MNNKGLVSIIIPMYNAGEEYTSIMIESIIKQTYTNWELIVVDDGSTDNIINIIHSFEIKDKRIKLIRRPNEIEKGAPSCRNIGIQNSKGEFVIFFDADDYIAPYCLAQRVEFITNNPQFDFVVFPMLAFKNEILDTNFSIWGAKHEHEIIQNFIRGTIPFVVVTNIYRRNSIIDKKLYWDTNLKSLQDSDYNIMALQKRCTYTFSNLKPDYFYRISGNINSISKNINSEKHFLSRLYFYQKITSLFSNDKYYKNDLLIITNVHFKKICFDNNKDHIKNFLSTLFLKKFPILKYKLYLIYLLLITLGISNYKIRNILLLIFTPSFEFRQRIHYKKFNKNKKKIYNNIISKYKFDLEHIHI